ncbi:MAG: hypothetical protein A2Y62_04285 [Candidatus Fischerbacteria bacterium RBG_13_37_8]|uniref:Glycosyltransferase RgtA/B/C/D-like domain-containing protein n=1 Tax=Candidatus Fischerbacteria bacterium RBG_13_37_8 TaxID=1817863 RepID=A0A1F5VHA8_9BACT|nr:MAG: hypothetical protein A2Y62_04285 [Candidatus Fischerbacteria bacterium RBG_13_37_8]
MSIKHIFTFIQNNRFWKGLLLLILCIAIIKFLYLYWYINHNPYYRALMWDSVEYDAIAQQFLHDSFWKGDVFIMPPGYPLFLRLIYLLFGHSTLSVLIIQNLLTLFTIVLIALIGRTLFNGKVGLIAVALYSLYGAMHFYDNKLIDNSLVNLLLVGSVLFFIQGLLYSRTYLNFFLSGLLSGAAVLSKPNIAMIFLLYVLAILFRLRKKGIMYALIVLLAGSITITPIAVRNYLVSHSPVMITAYGGLAFYGGNRADAKPYFSGLPFTLPAGPTFNMISKYIQETTGKAMSPAEISAHYYKKGLRFIVQNPVEWLKLTLQKAKLSIANYEQEANYSYDLEKNPCKKIFFIPFALILALASITILTRKFTIEKAILLIPVVVIYVTMIILYALPRLRTPAIPFLCILAGHSLYQLIIEKYSGMKLIRFFVFAVVFFFSLSIKPPYTMNLQANEYLQYGLAYGNLKDFKKAEYWINKSLHLEPANAKAYAGMAAIYKLQDRDLDTLHYYQRALKYNDNDAEIHNNLASLYFINNNIEKASYHLTRAYQLNPYHPSILYNMALLKIKEKNMKEAQHYYDRAMFFGARDTFQLRYYFSGK